MALVMDSFVSLVNGMNESLHPTLIPATTYARGVNTDIRNGKIRTRPALVKEDVDLGTGTFQGAGLWSLESGDRLVCVISGRVLSIKVDTMAKTDLGVVLDTTAQCFFCQVDKYMVIQDGTTTPVIIEDVAGTATIYAGAQSIPVGTIMTYAWGRLHVVANSPGKMYFTSGNVTLPSSPASGLLFTESEYWAAGGAHGLPAEMGHIGGLVALRNAATGTGLGGLYAIGRNGVSAFDVSISRGDWVDQNISQVAFFGPGTRSPWSVLALNNDVLYRGLDGLRTVTYSVSFARGQTLATAPISHEVRSWFDYESTSYLPYVSSAAVDNRLLMTVSGTNDRYFRGLVSLDTLPMYNMSGAAPMAYNGVWTGLEFGQVLTALQDGTPTAFVFSSHPNLYRIDDTVRADNSTEDIESRFITRAFSFTDNLNTKQIRFLDLWFSQVYRDTEVKVYVRPSGYDKWTLMGTRDLTAPTDGSAGVYRRVRFSLEQYYGTCNTLTGEALYTGTEFQFAIQWTGYLQIDKGLCVADVISEAPPDTCTVPTVSAESGASSGVDLSDWSYELEEGT
jgi:hypothetical protein